MKYYVLILTACVLALTAVTAPAQTRDRRLVGVRLTRAPSNTGAYTVFATVRILTNDPGAANLDFTAAAYHGTGAGGQLIDSRTIAAQRTPGSTCSSQSTSNCPAGSDPMFIDGGLQSGACTVEETVVTGGNPVYECICVYDDTEVKVADEVNVLPGQQITVLISPFGGLNDSAFFPPNDMLTVTVGSRADEAGFMWNTRMPSPMGGQGNSAASSLTQVDGGGTVAQQGEGPFEFWAAPGTAMMLMHGGGPNMPITLFWSNHPQTGALEIGNFSIDLDYTSTYGSFYNTLGIGNPCAGAACMPPPTTDASGMYVANWPVPNIPDGRLVSLQGLTADPAAPLGFTATARNDIGVQMPPTSAPVLPPFPAPVSVPAVGSTTPLPCISGSPVVGTPAYPWPRDVIVPNHGPTQSAPNAGDGTLHSMVGTGFDATNPSGTSVVVNGIAADVVLVRPQEILFRLVPAHQSLIAGPVVVTSTGGTSATVADQMENWVIATPPSTLWRPENPTGGFPPVFGFFDPDGGLQAARGLLPAGGQRNWRMDNLAPGQPVRAFVGQLSPCTGQIVVRCVGAALPVTGATCSITELFTQMPGPPSPIEDLRLQHLFGTSSFTVQAVQEDGGPGSSPFAGMTPVLGSPTGIATIPGDPFGSFTAVGANDALRVAGTGASSATGPYDYLILVTF